MERRDFVKTTAGLGGLALTPCLVDTAILLGRLPARAGAPRPGVPDATAHVAFVKTGDHAVGVRRALDILEFGDVRGRHLFLKPNFNSHHQSPGSTHDQTLTTLVEELQSRGAGRITVGDRSGMGDTREVMERKRIFRMGEELGFDTVVFDELSASGWEIISLDGGHWSRGFPVARPVLEADGVVQTCCLKTHQFGGHFTLSLKNSVGLVAKRVPGQPHDYMRELHRSPDQRRMIAEVNMAYVPDLVVLDGVEAFVSGGPHTGETARTEVVLAGTDRVALDAVGVAILRYFGTTAEVSRGAVFAQEQIARAAELGLGVGGPDRIELLTDDRESREYAARIREVLLEA
ncbi:MAG: DUF362 domain-containing protein [Gemmatimonadota bacterium]|jgi:uncharacterized protein (DUF362 family)|nr:MAG: DUF362 domain-containing protein [Gemmatimonadota bacterium]